MPPFFRKLLALPPEASTAAARVDALHLFVILTTMVGSALVFAAALWFVMRYPRRPEDRVTERVNAPAKLEMFVVGSLLSLFCLWWVIGFRQYVWMEQPPEDAQTVTVTAKQWMWKFGYEGGRNANDVLTVPLGRPIRLVMTSRDVIHSFYVPAFRVKQDVVPGRYTTIWFEPTQTGDFDIFCAEFCGVSHSLMRGKVRVLDREAYAKWLADPSLDASGDGSMATEGATVALRRGCVACHTLSGAPQVGPSWAGLYQSDVVLENGAHVRADEAYLTRSMMEPNADVVAGYKPVMPSYLGVLTPAETSALVAFIASLRESPVPSGVALPPVQGVPADVDAGGPR